ncbi:unnamed protein product, partial [Prorocentrum cordatum]
ALGGRRPPPCSARCWRCWRPWRSGSSCCWRAPCSGVWRGPAPSAAGATRASGERASARRWRSPSTPGCRRAWPSRRRRCTTRRGAATA